MNKIKSWVKAARLRTLPLSVSGILVASFYAVSQQEIYWGVFIFAILTTLGLQILSNFANDYGDGIKGTDNENRVGPARALQSGALTPKEMKNGIIATALLTLLSAMVLILLAFGKENFGYSLIFLLLGITALAAAIKYTVGESAYGYRGLGDLFVFIFFGLVSVLGCYFLYSKTIDLLLVFPAVAIGLLSVAVLNLNNMRDQVSDALSGKNTLVVKMGNTNAKRYHYMLIIVALVLILLFAILNNFKTIQYLFLFSYIPFIKHLSVIYKNDIPKDLDPELKKVALSTFLLSVLLCIVFQL